MLKFVEKVDDGHCNVIIFQNLKQMSGVDLIGLNRNSLMFFFLNFLFMFFALFPRFRWFIFVHC